MAKALGCSRFTVYNLAKLEALPERWANHVRLLADQHAASAVERGEEP